MLPLNRGGKTLIVNGLPKTYGDFIQSLGDVVYIVQKRLVQHQILGALHPTSVNTLRIVTIKNKKGAVKHLSTVLRIGTGGSHVDNWAVGGLCVGVGEDGKLGQYGFYKPGFGTMTNVHPDSGINFRDVTVPYYKEALELCMQFHSQLKIDSIGWDVAITPDGPAIIEGNDNWEISLMQICNGPLWQKFINRE